jgi:hypothetical protein
LDLRSRLRAEKQWGISRETKFERRINRLRSLLENEEDQETQSRSDLETRPRHKATFSLSGCDDRQLGVAYEIWAAG